jgi:immune inhibitor A
MMNFSNKAVNRCFATPHAKNCWADLESIGWRKVKPDNEASSTNMFLMLSAAKASGRTVSGTIEDSSNQISVLYLN